MMNTNNDALLEQFRDYLEKAAGEKKKVPHKLSLFSFFEELTALKNEIRIESRLIKQGLEHFEKTAERIEQGNRKIDLLVENSSTESEVVSPSAEQPVLQGLLDLHDTVQASLQTLLKSREAVPWFRRLGRCDNTILQSVSRGQKMSLERIVALLKECGAVPMDVAGCRFDPHTMRAVGTDSQAGLEDGVVSSEARTGFRLNNGEILRLADVRVNRL